MTVNSLPRKQTDRRAFVQAWDISGSRVQRVCRGWLNGAAGWNRV